MKKSINILSLFLFLFLGLMGCQSENDIQKTATTEKMYFPPTLSSDWETLSMSNLNWNTLYLESLKTYLKDSNTKSFMILVNGRIVIEEYFNGHSVNQIWQWNSAGKTLTSALTGIAQQENLLNINDKVSQYLGTAWTSAPLDKEHLITCKNLLTMTSGINDTQGDKTTPSDLIYKADAGTRWAYHNIFQKQMDVIAHVSNTSFDNYFNLKLKNRIGMDGTWYHGAIYRIYYSSTRSMARFGLLALNKGKWHDESIIQESFFNECITSSQNINKSYGYFWWINGKASFMLPNSQNVFTGSLIPNAPSDMYMAMGASDQRIYVIPSKKMVIIRMGESSTLNNPGLSDFDTQLWHKINALIN
ncbi:serine hydrolase [Flavobacterium columnare]|uniref:Class C beta-lactamase-related serine hydrolase n=1 Tax=Flavobacterium columnare TaxID=996 RepID=A0A437UA92_9FLAO|nr:serine hydrolase [Flavobacterium columnare]RVU90544.1 class C beta-lactamase-related serine hydrolase [Flavobacterium columnare]